MDIRDEVAQTCILIKSIPFETDVKSISTAVGAEVSVKRVFRYTEQADNSTRFIVQLNTRQDVNRLIAANSLYLRNPEDENVKVEVGFCPECIVPTEWVDDDDPSSDFTESNNGKEEQSDGLGCHGNQGETNGNGAVCGGIYWESDREHVNAKFTDLTVFSDKKETNGLDKKDRDVDALSSCDAVKQVQKSEDENTVVYRRPRQEATKGPSVRVLDMADQSPYDTPKPDLYEPIGDVYRPTWNMVNQQRPKSQVEPNVTTEPVEKGPRSVSVYVDGHKSLTETDLVGSPNKEKEKQTIFESNTCVVVRPTDKGNNDTEMLKMSKGHVTDTSSSVYEDNIHSKNTRLKSKTNELESTDFAENAETITRKGGSDTQIGVEAAGYEDSQRCTLQISSPPVIRTTDCDHIKDKDISKPSTGSETPYVYNKTGMSGVSEGQGSGSERLLSQSIVKHVQHDHQLGQGQQGDHQLGQGQQGDYQLGQGQQGDHQLGQGQQRDYQLGQGQQDDHQLGQGQQHAHQLGQGQQGDHQSCYSEIDVGQKCGKLNPAQPVTGHLGPTSPITEQKGIGQQQCDNQGLPSALTGQSGQSEQLAGQLIPTPIPSHQALTAR
ncbi:uncharacterized protein LOC117338899 [Pecten maximus]|uniref:uncharacterized protein LOC117338899 n=1 Tax=Pecten maximus TaxID=6579 RepID=UPI001458D68B|nr:uncharacterized protein LOC117338899 [Pecten maximus]